MAVWPQTFRSACRNARLNDRNIELIHEVLATFYQTNNPDLINSMAAKVSAVLSVTLPQGMNGLQFLQTIVKDYNYITANKV